MKIRFKNIFLLLLIIFLLSGCWDYEDINNRTITLSIGINEKDGKIIFDGEIAKLISESNQKNSSATITDVYYYKSMGKDFEEAKNDFDNKNAALDFFGAARAVAFSKEYAEKFGIEPYINRVSFMPGFRSSVLVVISEQQTNELFEEKVINDISTGHGIENTIRYLDRNGAAIYTTFQDIRQYISLKEIGFCLPYIKKEKGTINYIGLAIIKDSKLIGVIKAEDSIGTLFLLANKPSFNNTIPNPDNKTNLLSTKITLKKKKITTSMNQDQININIKLDLNSILIYEYIKEPISDEAIKKMESIIANIVKENVVSSIERSQKEYKSDIFGFVRYFKAENPSVYKKINWMQEYPSINFNVQVSSKIINYNLINTKIKK